MNILEQMGMDPMSWFLGDQEVASRLIKMTTIVSQSTDARDIARAFYEILEPVKERLPWSFTPLFQSGKVSEKLLAQELHWGFRLFAGRFIGGNDAKSIADTIKWYYKRGIKVNLDILGDAVFSEKEAQKYVDDYIRLFSELPKYGIDDSYDVSASIKVSAAYSQIDPLNPKYSVDIINERFESFFALMKRTGRNVFFDALEKDYREIQFRSFERAYKKYGDVARFVSQSYLTDTIEWIEKLARLKHEVGADLWVRLVLGAYHSFEQYAAQLRVWDVPVWTVKEDTNQNFRSCFRNGIDAGLHMVSGTHNIEHILYALLCGSYESQLIRGMGEPYALRVLVPYGLPVRIYVPVLLTKSFGQGIGFLVRRVDDNTGPESFLAKNHGKMMILELLRFERAVKAMLGVRL